MRKSKVETRKVSWDAYPRAKVRKSPLFVLHSPYPYLRHSMRRTEFSRDPWESIQQLTDNQQCWALKRTGRRWDYRQHHRLRIQAVSVCGVRRCHGSNRNLHQLNRTASRDSRPCKRNGRRSGHPEPAQRIGHTHRRIHVHLFNHSQPFR